MLYVCQKLKDNYFIVEQYYHRSIWVDWVKTNRLKGNNFWEVNPTSDSPWAWKKLLNLRREV